MLSNLLHFDWLFFTKKKAFYISIALFMALGFFGAVGAGFPWHNTYKNSPFVLTFLMGLFSLVSMFVVAFLAAQSLLRERDFRFDSILYATPLKKQTYLASRFLVIFQITVACFFLFLMGLLVGHQFFRKHPSDYGSFHIWYYLQPFLVLVIPNILFCTAVLCSLGAISKNKLMIYVSGLLLYFLYWGIAMFTNSPLVAGNQPVSAEAMSWSAKLDPFGVSAFFEQTRYWSSVDRNTRLLALEGNFLFNRVLYFFVSLGFMVLAYQKFSLTAHTPQKAKKIQKSISVAFSRVYQPILTKSSGFLYQIQVFWSTTKLDIGSVLKSTSFILIVLGWIFFMGIELVSHIQGGSRFPQRFATTSLIVNQLLENFPSVALIILLFYGSEVFWRSQVSKFSDLENVTPVQKVTILVSKWFTLSLLLGFLIAFNILMGCLIQLLFGYLIHWDLYLLLFDVVGFPLVLATAHIVLVQSLSKNKYMGLAISTILLTLTSTVFGKILGINHPLLKFTSPFQAVYSDMAGFDAYLPAFHLKMFFGLAVTLFLGMLVHRFSRRKMSLQALKNTKPAYWAILLLCMGVVVSTGVVISKDVQITSSKEENNWKQAYEEKYRTYQKVPQPVITHVKTQIHLYPETNSYEVSGEYTLANPHNAPLAEMLVYLDKSIVWDSVNITDSRLRTQDDLYGHRIYQFSKPLAPQETRKMKFAFKYHWSAFAGHKAFNAILGNGSFMRISNYYPQFGYQESLEIDNEKERVQRKMAKPTPLRTLEQPNHFSDYGFIHLDATISTSKEQTAIGVGELVSNWQQGDRNFFQYKTPSPIPFRFAVASARYQTQKVSQNGISIEAYYHPEHHQNIAHLLKNAQRTLAYCEKSFGKYPFKTIRFVEISSFVKGFAGTAYPTSFFMPEDFGLQNKTENNPEKDIINELVSHELSHMWWGNSQISPSYQEGSKILTETLAMYTELMLYKQAYGEEVLLDRMAVHQDIYLGERGLHGDEPLYKSHPSKPFLCYNKGLVVMYQLYKMLGEEKINQALKSFLAKHQYPNIPPTTLNLLGEFCQVADKSLHAKIDELFKTITTYDLKVQATALKINKNEYEVKLAIKAHKYQENTQGSQKEMVFQESVDVVIYLENGQKQHYVLNTHNGTIDTTLRLTQKPVSVTLDPYTKFLDIFLEDNEKMLEIIP